MSNENTAKVRNPGISVALPLFGLTAVCLLMVQGLFRPNAVFDHGYNAARASTLDGLASPVLRETASVISEQMNNCRIDKQEYALSPRARANHLFAVRQDKFFLEGKRAYQECFVRQLSALQATNDTRQVDELLAAAKNS